MKKNFKSPLGVGALVAGALCAMSANAMSVTYDFGGSLSYRYDNPIAPNGYQLPSYLQGGAAFTGSITFDVDGIADTYSPLEGAVYNGAIKNFTIAIVGNNWSLLPTADSRNYEFVADNFAPVSPPGIAPYDGVGLYVLDGFDAFAFPNDPAFVSVYLRASASDTAALNSTNAISDLSVFPLSQWRLEFAVGQSLEGGPLYSYAPGSLTSLSLRPSEVPVPAAAWLFGSGVLGLAGIARRRRLVA